MTSNPYLKVLAGTADQECFPLPNSDNRFILGRDGSCDLTLPATADEGVSREHCHLQRIDTTSWLLVDCSRNGTSLYVEGNPNTLIDVYEIPERSVPICAEDVIAIPSSPKPIWQFRLEDPNRTSDHVRPSQRKPILRCIMDLDRHVLRYELRGKQWDIKQSQGLRAQAIGLLVYMGSKNLERGGATICTRDELIEAVWGEEAMNRSYEDLVGLVREVRQALQIDQLIETKKGVGYRLNAIGYRDLGQPKST